MEYYKYPGQFGFLESGEVFMEVEHGWVRRQVEIESTNLDLIFPLAELKYDGFEEVQPIAKAEFESAPLWPKAGAGDALSTSSTSSIHI